MPGRAHAFSDSQATVNLPETRLKSKSLLERTVSGEQENEHGRESGL